MKLAIVVTLIVALLSTFCAQKKEEGPLGRFPTQISALPEGVTPENQTQEIEGSDGVIPGGIIARKSAWLRHHAQINTDVYVVGNCTGTGCLDPANPPTNPKGIDNSDSELTLGVSVTMPANRTLKADKIRLKNNASVQGTTEANKYAQARSASIAHRQTALGALPKLPFFLKGTPGTLNVKDSATPLAAGKYANLTVRKQKSLVLAGGFYQLNDIDMQLESSLTCQTQCIVLVKADFISAKKITLSAASANPNDFLIYVEGGNATANPMDVAAKTVQLGGMSEVTANIYAPNGRLQFGAATMAKGAFIANHVRVEPNSIITQGPPPAGTVKFVEAGVPATVEVPGKVKLDIPACALAADALITVAPKPDAGQGRTTLTDWVFHTETAFEFSPQYQQFECAVNLTHAITPAFLNKLSENPQMPFLASSEDGAYFDFKPGYVDANNSGFSAKINHFTIFLIASPPQPAAGRADFLQRRGNYVYGLTGSYSLTLNTYDVSNPTNIQKVGSLVTASNAGNAPGYTVEMCGGMFMYGNELIILVNAGSYQPYFFNIPFLPKLRRISLANPASPVVIGDYPIPVGTPMMLSVSAGNSREMTELQTPVLYAHGELFSGYTLAGVGKITFSNPAQPSFNLINFPGLSRFAQAKDGLLYFDNCCVFGSGIQVINEAAGTLEGVIERPLNSHGIQFGAGTLIYSGTEIIAGGGTSSYSKEFLYLDDITGPATTANRRKINLNTYSSMPNVDYRQIRHMSVKYGRILISATGTDFVTGTNYNGVFILQEQANSLPILVDKREFEPTAELDGNILTSGTYEHPFAFFPFYYPGVGYGIRAITSDTSPPVPGSPITFGLVTENAITLLWGAASDSVTPAANLQYKVVKDDSGLAGISTVTLANAKVGADLLQDWTANITSTIAVALFPGKVYYFTVLVRDNWGNTSLYVPARKATQRWLATGSSTDRRQYGTATRLLDGRVLYAGGCDENGNPLNTSEVFDPALNSGSGGFAFLTPMVIARCGHTASLLPNGRVLIAGGYAGGFVQISEIFDPVTNFFSPAATMILERSGHTATRLSDGRILIAGGFAGDYATNSAEIFDPATMNFVPTNPMSAARMYHSAVALTDGRVLITGGHNDPSDSTQTLATAEIFEPNGAGNFFPTASMLQARVYHTSTLLADGRVLITGGNRGLMSIDSSWPQLVISSAEIFDSGGGGNFNMISNLSVGRTMHSATLLNDGRVLITGGLDDITGGPTNTAEVFYPNGAGNFDPINSMITRRCMHAATLLLNGRVLVSGGLSSAGPVLVTNAELFE